MIILNETSLGMFYFAIAMILRETILISSMLLNVEVWTNITKTEINKLELVEKILIRRVIGTGRATPVAAVYLEVGAIPIRFLIRARRLMFLHYLLSLPENQLLARIYRAQKTDPVKNDWCLQVKEDIEFFSLSVTEDDIKMMTTGNLSTLMEALPHNEVDHEPGEPEASHQLPLDAPQTLLQPSVSHEDPVTGRTTLSSCNTQSVLTSNIPRQAL